MLHFRMDMPLYLMALYGSVMVAFVLLLRLLLKNHLPKFVFPVLWSMVLVRLLVPFSLSSPISAPVPEWEPSTANTATVVYTSDFRGEGVSASAGAASTAVYQSAENLGDYLPSWQLVLATVSGLGAIATATIFLLQKRRYAQQLKNSLLVEQNQTINALLEEMGMEHVLVFTCDTVASPLVCGTLHPRIYLPAGMDFRQAELLRHILAHETMHIKRRDNWLKTVMLVALCLHWYNPLVWFMSKGLASDLEDACDAAVLQGMETDHRKGYATSLLAMAISGSRSTLLYSAFSKTEVERRIKSVLSYKKATTFVLVVSALFVMAGTVVFATGGQAPFSPYLSSYCSTTSSRWGVRAGLSRDIVVGKNADNRADNVIFDVLNADTTQDPDIIANGVKAALAKVFGVEKSAFQLVVDLCLTEEEVAQEYVSHGLAKGADGFYLYKGEVVRTYWDEMLSSAQTREDGTVDLFVNRDRLGGITEIAVYKAGDKEFDDRTKEKEKDRRSNIAFFSGTAESGEDWSTTEQVTVVEGTGAFSE